MTSAWRSLSDRKLEAGFLQIEAFLFEILEGQRMFFHPTLRQLERPYCAP